MRARSILKYALVGILLVAFIIPGAFAASPQFGYAQSSKIRPEGDSWIGEWILNIDETMNVNRGDTPFFVNVYDNEYAPAGTVYLIRLSSTDPPGGLDPSLTSAQEPRTLSPGNSDSFTEQIKVSTSASVGTNYPMSTSHYYAMGHYPGTQYYPPISALKHLNVVG